MTLSLLICTAATAQAQSSPERLKAIQQRLALMQQNLSKLPPRVQKALSGGTQNALAAAKALQHMPPTPDQGEKLVALKAALQSRRASASTSYSSSQGPIRVNDPSTDLLYSLFEGMTQSETSTAWCGSGVVVGFNDSGSDIETTLFGPGGLSFSGASASTDGGNSFRNIGYINPGTNLDNFLLGDPVVNCTNASTFYLSQIAFSSDSFGLPTSDIMISKSTDGGFTWGDPVSAVSKLADFDSLDKDWSAIDPNNPNNIYITYTDFDESGNVCEAPRAAIEIVHSTDGGSTWSAPMVLAQECSDISFVQGSQVVVDSHGHVYVEWEKFPDGFDTANRAFRIAKSTDHASSFGPVSTIALGSGDGDNFALQGNFRSWLTGNLAVDRSGTTTDGNLYFIWEDGRFASRPDFESFTNEYRFGNIVTSRSTDGGRTWCSPVRVNNDPLYSSEGIGIDHFQPGVAVNANGTLAACWYDRRDDPFNFNIGRYCGTSTNYGNSWSNVKVDTRTWPPIHDIDVLINPFYLGDYDTVTTDQTKASAGFQGAYGRVDGAFGQDVFDVHVH